METLILTHSCIIYKKVPKIKFAFNISLWIILVVPYDIFNKMTRSKFFSITETKLKASYSI